MKNLATATKKSMAAERTRKTAIDSNKRIHLQTERETTYIVERRKHKNKDNSTNIISEGNEKINAKDESSKILSQSAFSLKSNDIDIHEQRKKLSQRHTMVRNDIKRVDKLQNHEESVLETLDDLNSRKFTKEKDEERNHNLAANETKSKTDKRSSISNMAKNEDLPRKSILDTKLPPLEDNSRNRMSRRVGVKGQVKLIPSPFRNDETDKTVKTQNATNSSQQSNTRNTPQPLPRVSRRTKTASDLNNNNEIDFGMQDVINSYPKPIPRIKLQKTDSSISVQTKNEQKISRVKKHYSNLMLAGIKDFDKEPELSAFPPPKPVPRTFPPTGRKLKSLTTRDSISNEHDTTDIKIRAKFELGKIIPREALPESVPSRTPSPPKTDHCEIKQPEDIPQRNFGKPLDIFEDFIRNSDDSLFKMDVIRQQTALVREKRNQLNMARKLAPLKK
ncbi:uncharacterized protein LOC120344466 [Styela clava]